MVSSIDLSTAPAGWEVWDPDGPGGNAPYGDLPSQGDTTSEADIPGGGDARRFFAVLEKDPPPLLEGYFDAAGPALPEGWTTVNDPVEATTVWEVGDPSLLPNLLDGNGTNCVGTNVLAGEYADEIATLTLPSPAVPIPPGGATLRFRQYIDSFAPGDVGAVRLLDASDVEIVEGDFPVTGIDGAGVGWTDESFLLPPSAADQSVKVVFEFTTDDDGAFFNGFYIDDGEEFPFSSRRRNGPAGPSFV